jgi:hypothetical protein
VIVRHERLHMLVQRGFVEGGISITPNENLSCWLSRLGSPLIESVLRLSREAENHKKPSAGPKLQSGGQASVIHDKLDGFREQKWKSQVGDSDLNVRLNHLVALRVNLLIPAVLLASVWQAHAVQFTVSQVGPPIWQYTVTFAPVDNYSIFQASTTITVTGLSGVTAAAGPTSTDFPAGPMNTLNLAWTAQVLNGGTTVVWTHVGGGTGNFPTTQHIFGFSITAPSAANSTVTFATSGFSRDKNDPLPGGGFSLDISGGVAGPFSPAPAAVPAMSPPFLFLTMLGLGCVAAYQAKRRLLERVRSRS